MKCFSCYIYCYLVVICSTAQAATLNLTLDTTPLIGHAAGPFSLAFQLTDGNGSGDGNSQVILNNFSFGGGTVNGGPVFFGTASGDISGFLLRDSAPLTYVIQRFSPGTALKFSVTYDNSPRSEVFPDEFGFSILDQTGAELPTQGGNLFNVLGAIDFGATPLIQTFGTDSSQSPVGGGSPITILAPQINIPEPASGYLAALGVCAVVFLKRRTAH